MWKLLNIVTLGILFACPVQPQGLRQGVRQQSSPNATPAAGTGTTQLPSVAIVVDGESNPLQRAVDQIQRKFGVPVSFEDPVWSFPGDLIRLIDTPNVAKRPNRDQIDPNATVPAAGFLRLQIPVDLVSQNKESLARLTLEAAIQDHRQRGNQGQFRLIDLGENGFSVTASRIRGITGVVGDTSLPLDVRISLAEIERTVPDTLSAIAQEVSARYGRNVTISPLIASLEPQLFRSGITRIGAQNESAREVLAKALRGIRRQAGLGFPNPPNRIPKMSWYARYDTSSDSFFISLRIVAQELVMTRGIANPANPARVVYWQP